MATLPVSYTNVSLVQQTFHAVGSASQVTSATIALHAGDAEAYINARLSKSYTLPLSAVPPLIQTLATDLTVWNLITRRNMWTRKQVEESTWALRYKEIVQILQDIAEGEVPLVDEDGDLIAQNTTSTPVFHNNNSYVQTFQEDGMESSFQDPNKLDDIADDREGTL